MNKFKKITKIISGVFLTFFIFLIIPAILFTLITSRTNFILGIRSFDVLTGSMEPKIPVGSIVFTMEKKVYQVGDVVTFKRNNITVTHRIVGVKNNQFQTKGDANKAFDPQLVNRSDVIGVDIFILPYLGKLTSFIKTIPGFLMLIALPNLIFIGFEFWNIKEEYKKEIEKRILEKLNRI